LDDLHKWLSEYLKATKMALQDKNHLLEKFGVIVATMPQQAA